VPIDEREAVVEAIEKRIVEQYDTEEDEERLLHIATEPVQRDGYVEQTFRSYAAPTAPAKKKRSSRNKKA